MAGTPRYSILSPSLFGADRRRTFPTAIYTQQTSNVERQDKRPHLRAKPKEQGCPSPLPREDGAALGTCHSGPVTPRLLPPPKLSQPLLLQEELLAPTTPLSTRATDTEEPEDTTRNLQGKGQPLAITTLSARVGAIISPSGTLKEQRNRLTGARELPYKLLLDL